MGKCIAFRSTHIFFFVVQHLTNSRLHKRCRGDVCSKHFLWCWTAMKNCPIPTISRSKMPSHDRPGTKQTGSCCGTAGPAIRGTTRVEAAPRGFQGPGLLLLLEERSAQALLTSEVRCLRCRHIRQTRKLRANGWESATGGYV